MDAAEKKPGGLALILGGGDPDSDESENDDSGELAFSAFKKALDSGDASKGLAAFKKLLEAADEDEPESKPDEDKPEEDVELDL